VGDIQKLKDPKKLRFILGNFNTAEGAIQLGQLSGKKLFFNDSQ
jgi:hypothetical protein